MGIQGYPQKKKVEWCFYKIYKKLTKPHGGRWSKIVLLQKDLFFLVQILTKHAFSSIFWCFLSLDQEVMQDSQVEFC